MKKIIVLLIVILSCSSLYAQTIPQGDWYAYITRNYLIKVSFTPDSLIFSRLRYDSVSTGKYLPIESRKIAKIVKHNKEVNVIVEKLNPLDSSIGYTIRKFVPLKGGKSYLHAIVRSTDAYSTVSLAEQFIRQDTESAHGWVMHTAADIAKVQPLKSISTMSKDEILRYIHKLHDMQQLFDTLTLQHSWGPNANEYLEYQYREIAKSLGYNPLFEGRYLDQLFTKYDNDPDVKMLLESYIH